MPLTEYVAKEALRDATDWLVIEDPPGALAAREGISNTIPMVMMGIIAPADIDELASIVEENGQRLRDPNVPLETHLAQLKAAVKAAFEHVRKPS
jgi:hypothetical protein